MRDRRRWRRAAVAGAAIFVALTTLFAWTGLSGAWRRPGYGETGVSSLRDRPESLRVMAWNLEKGRRPEGEATGSPDEMAGVLDRMAEVIRLSKVDVVLLAEVRMGCDACPLDQPVALAVASGMHAWAYGVSYRWGLPFYKVQNGTAILSRYAFEVVEIETLPGARPLYLPASNRRVLWVDLQLGDRTVRTAPIWLESHEGDINLRQAEFLLDSLGPEGGLLGGDFNAQPDSDTIHRLRESGRLVGDFVGRDRTFPSWDPERRIDFIFGPRAWRHRSTIVLEIGDLSDHRPVLTEFDLEDW